MLREFNFIHHHVYIVYWYTTDASLHLGGGVRVVVGSVATQRQVTGPLTPQWQPPSPLVCFISHNRCACDATVVFTTRTPRLSRLESNANKRIRVHDPARRFRDDGGDGGGGGRR